jgi:hypothetical protein
MKQLLSGSVRSRIREPSSQFGTVFVAEAQDDGENWPLASGRFAHGPRIDLLHDRRASRCHAIELDGLAEHATVDLANAVLEIEAIAGFIEVSHFAFLDGRTAQDAGELADGSKHLTSLSVNVAVQQI